MEGRTESVCVCSPWEGVGDSVWQGLPGLRGFLGWSGTGGWGEEEAGHALDLARDERVQRAPPSLHTHVVSVWRQRETCETARQGGGLCGFLIRQTRSVIRNVWMNKFMGSI